VAYSCFYWQITDVLETFYLLLTAHSHVRQKVPIYIYLTVTQLVGVIYLLLKARVPDR